MAVMPTIADIERQTRFESVMSEEGAEQFRRKLIEKWEKNARRERGEKVKGGASLADLPGGDLIVKQVIASLTPAIQSSIDLARASIVNASSGRQGSWWWHIQLLTAEQWAYITLRGILSMRPTGEDVGPYELPATQLVMAIGRAGEAQVEFERWKEEENAKSKASRKALEAAKKSGVAKEQLPELYKNQFEALKLAAKRVDTRAFRAWQKRLGVMAAEPWDIEVRTQIGALLVDLAVDHCLGWFTSVLVPKKGGKTERNIRITEIGRTAVQDETVRQEFAAPLMLPMITRPKPWAVVKS